MMSSDDNIIKHKKGYLKEDFRLFHLKDQKNSEFEFHYHDFNKIIVFLSGKVTYLIEGKAYNLKPWDILFVSSSDVHMPVIDANEPYERIVIWVNHNFLTEHSNSDGNLLTCFEKASQDKLNLLRLESEAVRGIKHLLINLEKSCAEKEFGSQILQNALFVQLIVLLTRLMLGNNLNLEAEDIKYDEVIGKVLEYINSNLSEDLSVDKISEVFYMNKYHLMHKFKKQTGYTVHNYILQKRLIKANALIKKGMQLTEVCLECGFGDYSNFMRAFKKMFGVSPKKYNNIIENIEGISSK